MITTGSADAAAAAVAAEPEVQAEHSTPFSRMTTKEAARRQPARGQGGKTATVEGAKNIKSKSPTEPFFESLFVCVLS